MRGPTSSFDDLNKELASMCATLMEQALRDGDPEPSHLDRATATKAIVAITLRNIQTGRYHKVMRVSTAEHDPLLPESRGYLAQYVERVVVHYLDEYDRIERLINREADIWRELYGELARHAYRRLLTISNWSNWADEDAADIAEEGCEIIFVQLTSDGYPFDIAFDAWAMTIVSHRVLYWATRSPELLDHRRMLTRLDQPLKDEDEDGQEWHEIVNAPDISTYARLEIQEWLLHAIEQLNHPEQQQIIIDTFLYQRSDEEIGAALGKTKNAVYIARHRALRRLKKILEDERK